MNTIFDTLRSFDRMGVALIREAHGTEKHRFPAVFSPSDITKLRQMGQMLFGKTRYTARQREVVQVAESLQHSWTTLAEINKHARRLTSEADRWKVWDELVAIKGSRADINAAGKELVESMLPAPAPRTTSMAHSSGDDGMTRAHLNMPTPEFQELRTMLEPYMDSSLPVRHAEGQAMVSLVKALMDNAEGAVKTVRHLVITATVSKFTQVLRGEGEGMMFACSDGTKITSDQLLNQLDMCEILGGIFHEELGPLDLRRFSRGANRAQKILLAAQSMGCVRPGCGTPADRCQPHHIKAWKHGGNSDIGNFALLCPRCNGRNDDDPGVRLNGRIVLDHGVPKHLGPWDGAQPQINEHPRAKLAAMHQLTEADMLVVP